MIETLAQIVVASLLSTHPSPAATQANACPDATEAKKRADEFERQLRDWASIAYFKKQNSELASPGPSEKRVVFIGDSILGYWNLPQDFPGRPFVNRAIGGQNSGQMLVRFRADVIALKPKVVVIMGGINDLAFSFSAEGIEKVKNNLMSMAEIARANRIRVIFSSLTPVANRPDLAGRPNPNFPALSQAILAVNIWLKDYAGQAGDIYVDFYSAMVDGEATLKPELSDDGMHPNRIGYKVMAPLVLKAVEKAEASK